MTNAMYKEDIEKELSGGCNTPGCDCGKDPHNPEPMFISQACHPDAPTMTFYFKGILTVVCSECEKEILSVIVASKPNRKY